MKMLYTANGRYIRCCTEEGTRPVIIVCEKSTRSMCKSLCSGPSSTGASCGKRKSAASEKMANSSNVTIHRSWQDRVQRLLVRGPIVVGTGDTRV